MKNPTLARRYAKALFALAKDAGQTPAVRAELEALAVAFRDEGVRRTLLNPLLKPETRRKAVAEVVKSRLGASFFDLLASRKRLDLLPEAAAAFAALDDAERGVRRAIVRTAVALGDAEKKAVEAALAKRFGGTVVGDFSTDPALIGGLWARVDDEVLDASLAGRMQSIKRALVQGSR